MQTSAHQKCFGSTLQFGDQSDVLHLDTSVVKENIASAEITKSCVIQATARVHNPFGIFVSFLIKAMILFQKMSQTEQKWDDSLPEDKRLEWNN